VLGAVFICSGIGKILKPAEFADAVAAFRILPTCMVNAFAITLPWIELTAGLAAISGIWRQSGGLLMMGLNIVFIIAATSAMVRGLDIECGCFTLSHVHSKVGWELLVRDAGLLVLCAPLIWGGKEGNACGREPQAQTV
jgi:uncharacterized membrane protein YphA (DoxX/SURF4 family)